MFFPVNAQYAVTDGTASPGTTGSPAGLQNYTPYRRAGHEIGSDFVTFRHGAAGRAAAEYDRLRYTENSISDGSLEFDDAASVGPAGLFPVNDTLYDHGRFFQRTFATGLTWLVTAVAKGVRIDSPDTDIAMATVPLLASGTVTVVGF